MKKFLLALSLFTAVVCTRAAERAVIFAENFDALTAGSADNPATDEISAGGSIDPSLTHGSQWKGHGLHAAGGALAVLHFEESDWFGNYDVQGYVETPYTDVRLDGGTFTVRFSAKSVPDDGATLHIELYDPYTTNSIDAAKIDITASWADYEVVLSHPGYGNHLAYMQIASEANDWLLDNFEIVQNCDGLMPPVAHYPRNVTYEQFTANWNPVPLATAYLVSAFSFDDAGKRVFIVENARTEDCSYTVTGTVAGTQYYYNVRSVNDRYTSAPSEPVKVNVPLTSLDTPVATEAVDISEDGFTARWEPVFRAFGYIVNLRREHVATADETATVLFEDFDKCEGSDSYTEPFYGRPDDYTNMPGWKFPELWMKTRKGMLGVDFYYSKYEDLSITSPVLDLSNSGGRFSLYMKVSGTKGKIITVTCGDVEKSYKLTAANDEFTLDFDNGSEATALNINYSGTGVLLFDEIAVRQTVHAGDSVTEQIGMFNTLPDISSPPAGTSPNEYTFTGLDIKPGDTFVYTVTAWAWSLGEDGVWGPDIFSETSAPMRVSLDGSAGLSPVEAPEAEAVYYDLRGLPVAKPAHGLYIKKTASGTAKVIIIK